MLTPEQTEKVIAHAISEYSLHGAANVVSTNYIRIPRMAVTEASQLWDAAGAITKLANGLPLDSQYRQLLTVSACVVVELACAEMDQAVNTWKETQNG